MHGLAGLDQLRQHVGQVQLALRVVAVDLGQRGEQGAAVEGIHAGVDFADRELLGGGVALGLGLDDPLDAAVLVSDDAAVLGGVVELHRGHRRRRAALLMRGHEVRDRVRGDQRNVAGEHDDGRAGVDVRAGGGDGVTGPLGLVWIATTTSSGRRSSSRRLGLSTTTTLPAPASSAAVTGQRISGRPQSGCRTLGVAERMRVPSPAAMMTTVGADTARIVVSGALPDRLWGVVQRQDSGFWSQLSRFESGPPSS